MCKLHKCPTRVAPSRSLIAQYSWDWDVTSNNCKCSIPPLSATGYIEFHYRSTLAVNSTVSTSLLSLLPLAPPSSPTLKPAGIPACASSSPTPLRLPSVQLQSPSSPPDACVQQSGSDTGKGTEKDKGQCIHEYCQSLFDHL